MFSTTTVSSQIIQVLDDLAQRFGIVIDWTQNNILPYLDDIMNRFIQYQIYLRWFWIVVCIIVTSVTLLGRSKFDLYISNLFECDEETITKIRIGIVLICLVGVIWCCTDLLKLKFIPEQYLFDYISKIVNK